MYLKTAIAKSNIDTQISRFKVGLKIRANSRTCDDVASLIPRYSTLKFSKYKDLVLGLTCRNNFEADICHYCRLDEAATPGTIDTGPVGR